MVIRVNHKPHVDKVLNKAIMERSRLKSKANKSGNQEDMEIYMRHRNYVVKLNKQTKRNHSGQRLLEIGKTITKPKR